MRGLPSLKLAHGSKPLLTEELVNLVQRFLSSIGGRAGNCDYGFLPRLPDYPTNHRRLSLTIPRAISDYRSCHLTSRRAELLFMVMKILKSLIAGCDLGKKRNVCLANQAILELLYFFLQKSAQVSRSSSTILQLLNNILRLQISILIITTC